MEFYKEKETDIIYWLPARFLDDIRFTFDKKKIYNFWPDYPEKLTSEEIEIFKRENPILAELKE